MTQTSDDALATHRKLSVEDLDAISAGMGWPRPEPHLPPHFPLPAPTPIGSGPFSPVTNGFKLL
jgi:hypothetical protein